jgi:putative two-component system response regulator
MCALSRAIERSIVRSPEILIVDDTPLNLDVLGSLLAAFRPRLAGDGATALQLARQDPPDLILLDVMMPDLDGFEVCRRLQADPLACEIPVIFITALGDRENETIGFEVGGVDYITKPFNPMVVRARVQTHLELKAVRDALRDENLRLESRVQARTADLQAALNRLRESAIDTVLRLGLAAEYKDDDTGRHVLRMSDYAVSVAKQLGWNGDDLDRLFHAALMHDIGKLALPDSILQKAGPLNAAEWALVKRHPLVGARILAGSDNDIHPTGRDRGADPSREVGRIRLPARTQRRGHPLGGPHCRHLRRVRRPDGSPSLQAGVSAGEGVFNLASGLGKPLRPCGGAGVLCRRSGDTAHAPLVRRRQPRPAANARHHCSQHRAPLLPAPSRRARPIRGRNVFLVGRQRQSPSIDTWLLQPSHFVHSCFL